MNQFIRKTLQFVLFSTIVFACISAVLFIVPELINITELPKDNYSEIQKSDIIIAGDSRADRQLDPALMKRYTALNTINIAQSAHDLYAVSKILLALKLEKKAIVLSASSWQLNDGAILSDYFRLESFGDLSFLDKLKLYKFDLVLLYRKQIRRFLFCIIYKASIRKFYYTGRKINSGFERAGCRNKAADRTFFMNHPFYLNPNYNGIKRKLLEKAIYNLSLLRGCKIIIYNGLVTNEFRSAAKNNGVYRLEKYYDKSMEDMSSKYKNIKYISYIDSQLLEDRCFYDPQHLCESGVPRFTKLIADEVNTFQ
jgi:hypothetical protein